MQTGDSQVLSFDIIANTKHLDLWRHTDTASRQFGLIGEVQYK